MLSRAPRSSSARWLQTGLALSLTLIIATSCASRLSESPQASFCDTYTRVFDREPEEGETEFSKLHPDTWKEIEDNLVACFTLCPEKCPE